MSKIREYLEKYHRERLMAVVIAAFALVLAVFSAFYYKRHSEILPVDVSGAGTVTEEYLFGIDEVSRYKTDYVKITGWVLKQGEDIQIINTHLLLQDQQTGMFYQMPTSYVEREDVDGMIEDEFDYVNSGIESVIRLDQLAGDYEIYIHYCNNDNDVLIDTGMQCRSTEIGEMAE